MIIIIDFGSQTCHLIGRRVRDLGATIKIIDPEYALDEIKKTNPRGIILSGGPAYVNQKGSPTIDKKIFSLGIPILGICYGWQLTAYLLVGKVTSGYKEYGPAYLKIKTPSLLFSNVDRVSRVWVSHGDTVTKLPKGFKSLGQTESVKNAACADLKRHIYGIQFHPEVQHTAYGTKILANFLKKICRVSLNKQEISVKNIIESIKNEVKNGKVICAVSGGVDSTVTATLIGRSIGKRLIPIYVDNGLMREGTSDEVLAIFKKRLGITPKIIRAEALFLQRLAGVSDPEMKRKRIGELYIKLFEKACKKIKGVTHLAQGTIYSDVIESKGTSKADKIKSHHNVGGLPSYMSLKLIEPLRFFYKDEVRMIGRKLGLPDKIVNKQVFPGPGQAIRIVGILTKERLMMQRKADAIVMEEIIKSGLYDKVYMSFSIMTNTVSTAVKGDERKLLEVVAVRVIESKDIMTTDWFKLPYEVLQKISSRIVNEVPNVSRVVYDITTKPPATMEWE